MIDISEYRQAHGRKPSGRATWRLKVVAEMTVQQCQAKHGDAHWAHMNMNNECPWCGAAEVTFYNKTWSETVRYVNSKMGPGPWVVQP